MSYLCPTKCSVIRDILDSLCKHKRLSRKSLASLCGISKVTAGKACDFLSREGLICERTQSGVSSHGPQPKMSMINPDYNCSVLDVYSRDFSSDILSLSGEPMTHVKFGYDSTGFFDENLRDFLDSSYDALCVFSPEYSIGTAVLMPDRYFLGGKLSPTDPKVNGGRLVCELVSQVFSPVRLITVTKEEALDSYLKFYASRSGISNAVCISLFDAGIRSSVIIGSELLSSRKRELDPIGDIRENKLSTVNYKLKSSASDPDMYADAVALACANSVICFNPEVILIESSMHHRIDGLVSIVKSLLASRYGIGESMIPKFVIRGAKEASFEALGAMYALRERFITETVEKIERRKNGYL